MLNPPLPQPDASTGLAPLLGIDDVARVLNVSRATVLRQADAGRIAETRIGSRRLFSSDAVRQYIAEATAATAKRRAERVAKGGR